MCAMKIPTIDIPQADTLQTVIGTVECIAEGKRTYREIGGCLGMSGRQGKYYYDAARILGFVDEMRLTTLGKQLVASTAIERSELLRSAILGARAVISLLEPFTTRRDYILRTEIVQRMATISELAPSTANRRSTTIIGWLVNIGVLKEVSKGNSYQLPVNITPPSPIVEIHDVSVSLGPQVDRLREYTVKERTQKAAESLHFVVDSAKRERANEAHKWLQNMIAALIRKSNAIPQETPLIDIYAYIDEADYIFEIKSITAGNARAQLRRGLSQLYEYAYLQGMLTAKLVLVIESPLPDKLKSWMPDYLENHRGIQLIWVESGSLCASDRTREELAFLWHVG